MRRGLGGEYLYDRSETEQPMNTIFFLIKFFNKPAHADAFVHGHVYANRLFKFKKAEHADASGRMDRHEGTVAWLQPGKTRLTINGMDVSEDLDGPVQVQKNWLNHLNVFCIHASHTGDLDLASLSNDDIEAFRQELMIPNGCLSLGKYAVVVKDVHEFINRMRSCARANGYRIAHELVKYYDPETFHRNFRDIESVFWKQDQFSFQREFRFVIDDGSFGKDALLLDIGDISDITLQLKSSELNGSKWFGGNLEVSSVKKPPPPDR